MSYSFLASEYRESSYAIVPFRKEDIFLIKAWRNDQMDVLRQNKVLTDEDQKHYYENWVEKSFSEGEPKIILFSFLLDEKCIGYGGLTNVDWFSKRAEISFLVDSHRLSDQEVYGSDFLAFLTLMKKVAFDTMALNRLFTETFAFREFHISILEQSGFRYEGRMKEHVFIRNKFEDSLLHGYIKKYYETER